MFACLPRSRKNVYEIHLIHWKDPHFKKKKKRYNMKLWKFTEICCCCSVAKSCPAFFDTVDCSMPVFPVLHYLLGVCSKSCPSWWCYLTILSVYPSPPALNLSQHWGLFQWVSSWHQMAKVLELQLQHHISHMLSSLIPTSLSIQLKKIEN